MFFRASAIAGALASIVLMPKAGLSQGQEAHCALIVASRPSLAEAHQFRYENPRLPIEAIFRSSNGWLAIAAGILEKRNAARSLAELKAKGYIPQDSYCSDGDAYVETVWVLPDAPASAAPQVDAMDAFAPFDARPLTTDEKRVLQAGLAYFGHYNGLLDGVWGNGTQAAFEDFARKRLNASDQNWVASELLAATLDLWRAQDWRYFDLDWMNASLQLPYGIMSIEEPPNGTFLFESYDGSVVGSVVKSNADFVQNMHEFVLGLHDGPEEPYVLRKDGLWVTTARDGGERAYMRSFWSARLGQWVSMDITFQDAQPEVAHFMIASFQQGPAAPLVVGNDVFMNVMASRHDHEGRLGRLAYSAIPPRLVPPTAPAPVAPQAVASPPPAPTPKPAEPEEATARSGTGFFLNADGVVMTNEHVAGGCPGMTVNGRPARLLAASEEFDLALVKYVEPRSEEHFLSFSPSAGRLNSDITVAGFPLQEILGGLNITRGAISSMQGMGGSWTRMQISAPVQAGNSGGPIVDRYGNVVGVVVSKLNALVAAELLGDVPQNVNFGIRGELGKTFAELHGVDFTIGEEASPLAPEDLAVLLEKATVLVECR